MSEHTVLTNDKVNSQYDVLGPLMPARAFFFIVVDEVGKDGFLVRKIYASPKSPYLEKMNLSPLSQLAETKPEYYGMMPKDYGSTTSIAEHVMGNNKSSYISTSSIFPEGSPRFDGKSIFIDTREAVKSGAKLVTTEEIITSLNEYKSQNPHLAKRVDKIAGYVREVDKEILIHGEKVPAKAIFTPESLKFSKGIQNTARVVQVIGIVLTAYDLEQATEKSIKLGNAKPIKAEVIRQVGGWGGFVAGAKLGSAGGAALGIETGPGMIVTGLIGGIIGGTAGYYGADWIADHIDEN